MTPYPPLTHCLYSIQYLFTRREGGGELTRIKVRGAIVNKATYPSKLSHPSLQCYILWPPWCVTLLLFRIPRSIMSEILMKKLKEEANLIVLVTQLFDRQWAVERGRNELWGLFTLTLPPFTTLLQAKLLLSIHWRTDNLASSLRLVPSLKYSPAGQWPGFLGPGEEEGDVSGLYEWGADAVGQARQLLQAVRVQAPVPGTATM